ncbi:MAG TPA: class I SAM-dependent rRNA methyltransferase [Bacteroidota bacterium]|nr:class I SAM-dependent rRNA methyltransferase [Bacteroidota bacterium]
MEKYVILKRNEEHRLAAGHQWIFSNELASIHGNPEAGDLVGILRHDKRFLGQGFYHPHSLIAVRFLTETEEEISFDFFERRIQQAYTLRKQLYPHAEAFRLVYSESDFLPGLVIDKYNEFFSLQIFSAGMEQRTTLICDVLESMFHPKAIVARNDVSTRTLEELPEEKTILRGNPGVTIIDDGRVKFEVDVMTGQKTGFFLDQRENRKSLERYVAGKNVLDCFSNEGGFALHAAKGGAASITAVDISEPAIAKLHVNARLNNIENLHSASTDVFDYLKLLQEKNKKFDVVILDPPSFTKSKKNIPAALQGYKQINAAALYLINAGGFLATASCSHHISKDGFFSAVEQAAMKAKRKIQLLEFAGAAPDHPVLPAMPETEYLKFAIFAVH